MKWSTTVVALFVCLCFVCFVDAQDFSSYFDVEYYPYELDAQFNSDLSSGDNHTHNTNEACHKDDDCNSFSVQMNKCINGTCVHKTLFGPFTYLDAVSSVLCFLGGALANAGGLGGGAIFVPVLILLDNFTAVGAIPISKIMIFGAAIGNYVINVKKRHPNAPNLGKPMIDYTVTLVIEPMIVAGSVLGVLANISMPNWLITLFLVLLLVYTTFKTIHKGISTWKEETRQIQEQKSAQNGIDTLGGSDEKTSLLGAVQIESIYPSAPKEMLHNEVNEELQRLLIKESKIPWLKIGATFLAWLITIGISVAKSVSGIESCGWLYWFLFIIPLPLMIGFTVLVLKYVRAEYKYKERIGFPFVKGDIVWNTRNCIKLPIVGYAAGIGAGLLGIAAGVVISPVLLDLGVPATVTSATSAFMILFTSSATTAQFLALGVLPWQYALWFCANGFLCALFGQFVVGILIKKYKKTAFIIFAIGGFCIISVLCMGGYGIWNVITQFKHHFYGPLKFRNPCSVTGEA